MRTTASGSASARPSGWVETTYRDRAGLAWFAADGSDPAECLDVSARAADWVRSHRAPAFLHLRTVRYLGHAGSDVESGYRSRAEILADYARDPLLGTARMLVATGACSADEVLATYDRIGGEVARVAEEVLERPRLRTAAEVMAPIATEHREQVARRVRALGERGPVEDRPALQGLTLAQAVNRSLAELLAADDRVLVFGQDVGRKGGVYGVTRGLRRRFGGTRVFDTLLDEQSILGTALGLGLQGFTPVPEVQYLAYLHNAADQLRGEAATLGFFSRGAYRNPLVAARRVVRLPEGLRRALPQRRQRRGAARHPRCRRRLPGATGRRRGDAAHLCRRRRGRRPGLRLPRAHRALPPPRPVRRRGRPAGSRRTRTRATPRPTSPSGRHGCTETAATSRW